MPIVPDRVTAVWRMLSHRFIIASGRDWRDRCARDPLGFRCVTSSSVLLSTDSNARRPSALHPSMQVGGATTVDGARRQLRCRFRLSGEVRAPQDGGSHCSLPCGAAGWWGPKRTGEWDLPGFPSLRRPEMSQLLLDAAGRRRSPATMPGFHAGRPPRNKGRRYPADPPKIEEIVAVMRQAGDSCVTRTPSRWPARACR